MSWQNGSKNSSCKKILIVLPNDALGGAEQFLKLIAEYYIKKRCLVFVASIKAKKFEGWENLKGHQNLRLVYGKTETERGGILFFLKNILVISNRNELDLIYSSHVHVTGFIGLLRRLHWIKSKYFIGRESTSVFLRFQGFQLRFFKFLYRYGYPKLDLLICQTDFMKKQLIDALPRLEKKIKVKVIPNPIDLSGAIKQRDSSVGNYENYIVAAGRLIKLKGFAYLIEALSKLKEKNLNLVILGEGPEKQNLEALSEKLNVHNRVFLHGWTQNVYPFFRNARACVVSSEIEGFPNVLLQMMSQNTRVVSTKCAGGIDEIPGIYSCDTKSPDSLYKAIEKCLAETSRNNRELFDEFLEKRSVKEFVRTVEAVVEENNL